MLKPFLTLLRGFSVVFLVFAFQSPAFASKEKLESLEVRRWKKVMATDLSKLSPRQAHAVLNESVRATQALLMHQGTRYSALRIGSDQAPGFLILADEKGKPLNQLASEFEKHFPRWKLVYSPVHSLRGTNGFLNERGRQLGLANRAIEMQSSEPTFIFHRVHLAHHQARLAGVNDPLGAFAVLKREHRSDPNVSIHPFFTADSKRAVFQDLEARIEALRWGHAMLRKVLASSPKKESIDGALKLIRHENAAAAEAVKQIQDLAARGETKEALRTDTGWMRPSVASAWVMWERKLILSAYRKAEDSGWKELPEMTDLIWEARGSQRSQPRIGMGELLVHLKKAELLADESSLFLKVVEGGVSDFFSAGTIGEQRKGLRRVLEGLEALEKSLDRWKKFNSRVQVPQF